MIRYLLIALLVCSACKKKYPDGVIRPNQMREVLEEIHITGALLEKQGIYQRPDNPQVTHYYNYIYQKHNITQQQLKLSLNYYLDNPKEYLKICKEVTQNLHLQDSITRKANEIILDTLDVWTGKNEFIINNLTQNKINFSFPIKETGRYYITAKMKVYPDNYKGYFKPSIVFTSQDSTLPPLTVPIDSVEADGKEIAIDLSYELLDSTYQTISGEFLTDKNTDEMKFKHVDLKAVRIYKLKVKENENHTEVSPLEPQ